jgi:type III secretion protein L
MVIWLRNPSVEGLGAGAGVDDDIVRGEQLAEALALDDAWQALRTRGESELAAAQQQAQALLDEARVQADALVEQAAQRFEEAAAEGYDAGMRNALADWHQYVARKPDVDTARQRQHDRLAELVALAVERLVAASDPTDLFRRAVATLEQIVADGSPLDVRVHPSDLRAANAAFGEAARSWREVGCAVRLRVQADASLAPGACVCDSDLGSVDASLDLQLASLRTALARAVSSIAAPDDDAWTDDVEEDVSGLPAPGQSLYEDDASVEQDVTASEAGGFDGSSGFDGSGFDAPGEFDGGPRLAFEDPGEVGNAIDQLDEIMHG